MNESSSNAPIFSRQCSCGKTNDQIDGCGICREYREKQFSQIDSFILSALKQAMLEAFFKQQYYNNYHNGGNSEYYGGQAQELVAKLYKSPELEQLFKEIEQLIISKKDEWYDMAIEAMKPKVKYRGETLAESWDFKDGLYATLHEVGRAYAKEVLQNDEALKERIRKAVQSKDYTVKIDVRVEIVEKRESEQ